ncbi:hypothetical protein IWQ60_009762 [Tieghemiomyces parasiticus]|uniref:FHA domain-containing protein n=1 Tax=Tieghemiomyces parasiticus TaxID=78921 RepID=A0A9W7ZLX2_9FUNG|nr:hypothetical protein IWQ60_009762 [Tieghemiomyces parasiticus]
MSAPSPPLEPVVGAVAAAEDSTGPAVPHIRFAPHIPDVRHCLYFEAMDREVPDGTILKVGRFTDRVSQQPNRIAFKSKVVSRSHAEIWSEGGHLYIRDTKSSSGTFLNHIRLSLAGVESPARRLHDGDILQLGVDYQGGVQDIYKCVKIRLEINRAWQRQAENPYRLRVMRNLQNMFNSFNTGNEERHECCICLYAMGPFQALFVAPCSHCFHFKCVKPIVFTNTGFCCPLCRTYADLEAPVEEYENDVTARSQERQTTEANGSVSAPPPPDHPHLGNAQIPARASSLALPPIDQSQMMDVDSVAVATTPVRETADGDDLRPGPRPDGPAQATPVPVSGATVHTGSDEESTPGHSLSRDQTHARHEAAPSSPSTAGPHHSLHPHHHNSPTAQVAGRLSSMAVTLPSATDLPVDDSGSDAAFMSEESMAEATPAPPSALSGNGQAPPATRSAAADRVPYHHSITTTRAGALPSPTMLPSPTGFTGAPGPVLAPLVNMRAPAPLLAPLLNLRPPAPVDPNAEVQPLPAAHLLLRNPSRRRAQSCATEPTAPDDVPDSPMMRTFAEAPQVALPLSPMDMGRGASHRTAATHSSGPVRPSMGRTLTASALSRSPPSATDRGLMPPPPAQPQVSEGGPAGPFREFRRRLSDSTDFLQNHRTVNTSNNAASPLASVLNHLRMVGNSASSSSSGSLGPAATSSFPPAIPSPRATTDAPSTAGVSLASSPGASYPLHSTSPASSLGGGDLALAPSGIDAASSRLVGGPPVPRGRENTSSWVTDTAEDASGDDEEQRKRTASPFHQHHEPRQPQHQSSPSSTQPPPMSPGQSSFR